MRRLKRLKNKTFTEKEITLYCMSVEEVLKKINERHGQKENRRKEKKEKSTASTQSTNTG